MDEGFSQDLRKSVNSTEIEKNVYCDILTRSNFMKTGKILKLLIVYLTRENGVNRMFLQFFMTIFK